MLKFLPVEPRLRIIPVGRFVGILSDEQCGFSLEKFVIWNVPDLVELRTLEIEETVEAVITSQKTFELIKGKVDDLVGRLELG